MLQADDLDKYANLYNFATENNADLNEDALRNLQNGETVLTSGEIWLLAKSAEISCILGDVPEDAARVLLYLQRQLQGNRCLDFSHRAEWIRAIAWARGGMEAEEAQFERRPIYMRQRQVGQACRRLRERGYKIQVGAYGPHLAPASEKELLTTVDNFAARIGGLRILEVLFGEMRAKNLHHNGMWLFGNTVPGVRDEGHIALPYGWLLTVAIRNISKKSVVKNPDRMFDTMFALAKDYMAIYDCQRYGQYEHINLDPVQIPKAIREAVVWREAFTSPQAPQVVVSTLSRAFSRIITTDDRVAMGVDPRSLFAEVNSLLDMISDSQTTIVEKKFALGRFPSLVARASGKGAQLFQKPVDPIDRTIENQEGILFYGRGEDFILLPRSLTASNFCFFIYKLVWQRLEGDRAAKIVGDSMEHAIDISCQGKAPQTLFQSEYLVGSQRFEIDYATRDRNRIVLFETKSKSLTVPARSGNSIKFFVDFSQSYLAMLRQLARHEINIRAGQTELTNIDDEIDDLRIVKLAVSPLSYGQISDKMLLRSVMGSISRAEFKSPTGVVAEDKTLSDFNRTLRKLFVLLQQVAPNENGEIDLGEFLFNVHWLDLGELIYILNRSTSVSEASRLLLPITYASRDFWTEMAFSERQGMFEVARRPLPEDGGPAHDEYA